MAKPINRVLVIVGEESGCCAIDSNALTTAFPSAIEGIIAPIAIVKPAVMIETNPIIVMLSMFFIFCDESINIYTLNYTPFLHLGVCFLF